MLIVIYALIAAMFATLIGSATWVYFRTKRAAIITGLITFVYFFILGFI